MSKINYADLIEESKKSILLKNLSQYSYTTKKDLLKKLIEDRKKIFLNLKIYSILLILDMFAIYLIYSYIFSLEKNTTYIGIIWLIFCFFLFFALPFLTWSIIEEIIKIRKAYKKFNTTHKKMKNYLEIQIELQENEVYKALNQEKCNDLSKVIYEHLAIDMNLDASMSERVAESVRKNLERFVFRDPSPKKVSKYYDLIDRD